MTHLWKLPKHYTCKRIHFISSYKHDWLATGLRTFSVCLQISSAPLSNKEPLWCMTCPFLKWWFDRVSNGTVSHRKWNSTFCTKELNFYTMDPPGVRRDIESGIKRTPRLPSNSQQTLCHSAFNLSDISYRWNRTPKSDAGNLFYFHASLPVLTTCSQHNLISS